MPKASELKRGSVVEISGSPHIVKQIDVKSPSSRGASTLYKIRFNDLKTGQKRDETFKGDDLLPEADCIKVKVQFSYIDADSYVFMNLEDYSQYSIDSAELEDIKGYLVEGLEGIIALVSDDQLLTIELPNSVSLEIVDTAPGIKGATATGRTKPAKLQTGLEIQIPEYLEPGEIIKVNTVTGKFISKA